MKKKYNMKRTLSMAMFISEFGEAFTSHMKQRLLEIGKRCVLIRKEPYYCFDLKHVEHIKHNFGSNGENSEVILKEYTYGQLLVNEEILYYSEKYLEEAGAVQFSTISDIYNGIDAQVENLADDIKAKRIDDSNIDYLVDHLLAIYPPLSKEYLAIIKKYKK